MRRGVVADSIWFAYGKGETKPILSDVSFEVELGDVVALMGPSGSGKSTILQLLGNQLSPTKGQVRWLGRPTPESIGISWIQQTTNVFGRRSVEANIAMALYADDRGPWETGPEVESVLQTVGMSGFGHRKVNTLSGGERQRVVIARALAGTGRLVLADEPTGQLDADNTAAVCDALIWGARRLITSRPVCVVIATHDRNVADRCDRILRLVNGRIVNQ